MTITRAGAVLSREQALAEVERVAREVFGYEELRPGQAEAMAGLLAGSDVLLVIPTGAGKSAVYQVPALVLDGPTPVISPLIALQRDQVRGLLAHGFRTRAYAVSSAMSARERAEAWAAVAAGEAEFLFLAREQLANEHVLERVRQLRPTIVAVDEAHTVSSWGHDFHPDYLRLGAFIDALDHPRVIALTATAALPVRVDIVQRLRMRDPEVIVRGFARPNIELTVVRARSEAEKREAVVLRAAAEAKPGLVYASTRREAEEYVEMVRGYARRRPAGGSSSSATSERTWPSPAATATPAPRAARTGSRTWPTSRSRCSPGCATGPSARGW